MYLRHYFFSWVLTTPCRITRISYHFSLFHLYGSCYYYLPCNNHLVIGHGLLKTFWHMKIGCVLKTAGSFIDQFTFLVHQDMGMRYQTWPGLRPACSSLEYTDRNTFGWQSTCFNKDCLANQDWIFSSFFSRIYDSHFFLFFFKTLQWSVWHRHRNLYFLLH